MAETKYVTPRRLCMLAVGVAVAHLAVTIAAPGSAAAGWLINAAFVSGAVLALWRAASSRSDRAAWVCIGAGLLCQAFGDRYYKLFLADAVHVSQPSVADVGYLAFYPLAAAAVLLLLRTRLRSLARGLALDAAVGALAALALVAALIFPDVLTTSGGDLAATVTNLAYPTADLILLGLLVGGMYVMGGRADRGLVLIAATLVLFVTADSIYLYQSAAGGYEVGGPLDALWSFAAVAMGAAAWQPAARRRLPVLDLSSRTFAWVVGATVAATAVQTWDHYHRTTPLALYLAVATILGALARLGVAVSEQKRDARELAETEETLRNVTETIEEVFWVSSVDDGPVLYVNPMYERLFARPASQLYDDSGSWVEAVHPEDRERVRAAFASIRESGEVHEEFRIVRPDGEVRAVRAKAYVVPARQGVGTRIVCTCSDVTSEHEARDLLAASEARYRKLALRDPLTGLANRALFNERLAHLLARRGPVSPAAVIMIDLDGFKRINDTLGHGAGDELLTEVAHRLLRSTRPEDTVARLGGDEFCVVMTSYEAEVVANCGERIAAALKRPYEVAGVTSQCSASVGVAVHEGPGETMEALLRRADAALYEAKAAGGARRVLYEAPREQVHRVLSGSAA
jgi:diguanylate cyclase (GGDEF)-like protein/PAS domain S-box-containing protein